MTAARVRVVLAATAKGILGTAHIWLTPLVLGAIAIWAVSSWLDSRQPVGVSTPATTAREVAKTPTEAVVLEAPSLQVYPNAVKKKLNLPQPVQDNPRARVIAASKVQADERPHTVTTIVDTATGVSTTYDRADPLPWMAQGVRGEAALLYGYKSTGSPVIRMEISQDLLQIKALRLQAKATADTDGQWFTGVGVAYRW